MPTVTELLKAINEDDYLKKLAEAEKSAEGGMEMPPENPPQGGNVGAATMPSEAPSGAQSTGEYHEGPGKNLKDQLGGSSADKRVLLMDAAMEQAGMEHAQTNKMDPDEAHNAGIQPRTGVQEMPDPDVQAPAMPGMYQDNYTDLENPGAKAASDRSALSVLEQLAAEISGNNGAAKTAGTSQVVEDEVDVGSDELQKVAEECIAQGMFVEKGIELALSKSAEDGILASLFAPSLVAAHACAIEKVAESGSLDKLAEALADRVAVKLAEKLGIAGSKNKGEGEG